MYAQKRVHVYKIHDYASCIYIKDIIYAQQQNFESLSLIKYLLANVRNVHHISNASYVLTIRKINEREINYKNIFIENLM